MIFAWQLPFNSSFSNLSQCLLLSPTLKLLLQLEKNFIRNTCKRYFEGEEWFRGASVDDNFLVLYVTIRMNRIFR